MLKMLEAVNALAAFLTLLGICVVAWGNYQAWETSRDNRGAPKKAQPVLRGSFNPFAHIGEVTFRWPATNETTSDISL